MTPRRENSLVFLETEFAVDKKIDQTCLQWQKQKEMKEETIIHPCYDVLIIYMSFLYPQSTSHRDKCFISA